MVNPVCYNHIIENSIWHGLMHKEDGIGKTSIELKPLNEETMVCIIGNNGIGGKKAEEIKNRKKDTHKSLGSKITGKRLEIINALFGQEIKMEYTDLKDKNNKSLGTRITLHLPYIDF